MRAKLKEIKEGLRKRMHEPLCSTREMAWPGGPRLVQLPRRAHQLPRARRVPLHMSSTSGGARSGGAARRRHDMEKDRKLSRANGCLRPRSSIRGRPTASPSNTRGGSRMRESRPYGSVRGALSNGRPYRDRTSDLRSGGTTALHIAAASGPARKACRRAGARFRRRYVCHQSGHRTFVGVRVAATTVACSVAFRRRSPSLSSARWTSHGSSLIWA